MQVALRWIQGKDMGDIQPMIGNIRNEPFRLEKSGNKYYFILKKQVTFLEECLSRMMELRAKARKQYLVELQVCLREDESEPFVSVLEYTFRLEKRDRDSQAKIAELEARDEAPGAKLKISSFPPRG